jgi:hypothetical protein
MTTDGITSEGASVAGAATRAWEIKVPHANIRFGIGTYLLIGLFALVLIVMIPGLFSGRTKASEFLFFAAMLVGAVVSPAMTGLTRRRRMEDWAAPDEDRYLEAHLRLICQRDSKINRPGDLVRWKDIAGALLRRGVTDRPLLLYWREKPPFYTPILMPFEPRLLNESDPAFRELAAGVIQVSPEIPSEDLPIRSIFRRGVLIQGGWILLLPLAALLIKELMESIERRSPTMLLWSMAVVVAVNFLFFKSGDKYGDQLLVAPGSLILRRASRRSSRAVSHVFGRGRAALIVIQKQKGACVMAIADQVQSTAAIMTDKEVAVLLGAWLSPLDPPPVERLKDFE